MVVDVKRSKIYIISDAYVTVINSEKLINEVIRKVLSNKISLDKKRLGNILSFMNDKSITNILIINRNMRIIISCNIMINNRIVNGIIGLEQGKNIITIGVISGKLNDNEIEIIDRIARANIILKNI